MFMVSWKFCVFMWCSYCSWRKRGFDFLFSCCWNFCCLCGSLFLRLLQCCLG